MPKLADSRVPSYRLHSQSGQALVTLNGRIAAGRQTPEAIADLSVAELIARYKTHVETYYRRPDGEPTGEADNIRHALKPLGKLYGTTPATEFLPLKLKAVREAMIDPKMFDATASGNGWCRRLVNHSTRRIRAMFRWAVEDELLQPSVYHGLLAVTGLKHGRTEARESDLIMPVDDTTVEATLPHLTTVVASMVRLQRLTGARPGEFARMRTADVDTTGTVWLYQPAQHKTAHHERQRVIAIGPRTQTVLQSFLKPLNPAAYIFNPANAVAEVRQRRNAARKTPAAQGNRVGINRKRSPRRRPHDHFDAAGYRKAIARACDLAFPVPDHQLAAGRGPRPQSKCPGSAFVAC